MGLVLEITTKEGSPYRVTLEHSQSVGRSADIRLKDPKLSKKHAFFESGDDLQWYLSDLGSKNGTRLNGEKVEEKKLLHKGDEVRFGDTTISVVSLSISWVGRLNQYILQAQDKVKDAPWVAEVFVRVPVLKFTKGPQYGEEYILYYGPRYFGGESEDIQIHEPLCPSIAFTLVPTFSGVEFGTDYPEIVLINDESLEKKLLQKGDKITIHNSVLKVEFLNQ